MWARSGVSACPVALASGSTLAVLAATITIDTEADHDRGWVKTNPLRFASVTEAIPDVLTPLFQARRAHPTYLLTSEVLSDPRCVDVLRSVPDAELGTHLHGDHVQPAARAPDPAGAKSWDFNCFYPEEIERAKLEAITLLFRSSFGYQPRSYRAGRYAASGRTARMLADLGYAVDTSVTPLIRWVNEIDFSQQVDYRHAPLQPYQPSLEDLAMPGSLPLLEVPITIVERPRWWRLGVNLAQRATRRPQVSYPVWLRPSTTSWPWLYWIVRSKLDRHTPGGLLVFNIMFHSMEVVAGASPYSPDAAAAQRVIGRLGRLLGLLDKYSAQFLTLSELAELRARTGGD
jgi:hypothetical protein